MATAVIPAASSFRAKNAGAARNADPSDVCAWVDDFHLAVELTNPTTAPGANHVSYFGTAPDLFRANGARINPFLFNY